MSVRNISLRSRATEGSANDVVLAYPQQQQPQPVWSATGCQAELMYRKLVITETTLPHVILLVEDRETREKH